MRPSLTFYTNGRAPDRQPDGLGDRPDLALLERVLEVLRSI